MDEDHGRVREPLVDGLFYASDPTELRGQIQQLIHRAPGGRIRGSEACGLLCPSASYDYVGATMAAGYRHLGPLHEPIVVALAAGHHVDTGRVALPESRAYRTPFGLVPIVEKLVHRLGVASECFCYDDLPHMEEHAIETQLPFLQYLLGPFQLLPLLVGPGDEEAVAAAVARLKELLAEQDRKALLVLGTNLTSYQSRSEARREGSRLLDLIRSFRWRAILSAENAFTVGTAGCAAIALFLALCDGTGECSLVARANSSVSSADPSTTVEYAACVCSAFDEGT